MDDFYIVSGHYRDSFCCKCRRAANRLKRDARNKTNLRLKQKDPLYFRRKKLMKLYGITHEQWVEMYEAQNGRCAICGGEETTILYNQFAHLVVDHNHFTGKVRGLLCRVCNARLAPIEDEQFFLLAREYLARAEDYVYIDANEICRKIRWAKRRALREQNVGEG